MNILQVCPNYLPSVGGVEVFVSKLANELKIKGANVFVLCFSNHNAPSFETINGIHIYRIKPLFTISSQQIALFLSKKITNILKHVKPDIIHFHYPSPLLSNALLRSMKKANYSGRFYVHWHGDIVGRKLLKKWYTKSSRNLLDRADKISSDTINYALHSCLLNSFLHKTFVIPAIPDKTRLVNSGVNISEKSFISESSRNRKILFSFGRFVKWKGFDYLIDAMNHLDENEYVLYLGGYGKYEKKLKKASKKTNIFFVGLLDDSKKYTYITMSDVFVFPSVGRQEAFGITLAEAMCLGSIPVLFDKPDLGAREIAIPNYSCICAEKISSISLANAIKKACSLSNETKNQIKSNITKIMNEKCSDSSFSKAITLFYQY